MQIKVRLDSRLTQRWAKHFSKQTLLRAARVMGPTLVALTFAGVANTARAQGTISFSGAQTFMQTVQTFAIYAGCQGRSKTRPLRRSKSRPVVGREVVEYLGEKGRSNSTCN
jgi:hypothetical protein